MSLLADAPTTPPAEPPMGPPTGMAVSAADIATSATDELDRLIAALDDVRAAMIGTIDGYRLAGDLAGLIGEHGNDADGIAAMVSPTLALTHRLCEVFGPAHLHETTARTDLGDVCLYDIAGRAVLTVFTRPDANVALVHHHARRTAAAVAQLIGQA